MRDEDFSGLNVADIMSRWPATIGVFIDFRMHCIGCPIGVFHNVTDACAAHGLDEADFSAELLDAMQRDPQAHAPSAFGRRHAITRELETGV